MAPLDDDLRHPMNRTLHLLLGLAALLFGLSYLGWIGFNLLIEETEGFRLRSIGQIVGPILFIGFGGFWIWKHSGRDGDAQ